MGGQQQKVSERRRQAFLPSGEQRLVQRLHEYWESKCAGRTYPSLDDIEVAEIADLWSHCFVLDAFSRQTPYFLYLGSELARYTGVFLSGDQSWSQTLLDKAVDGFYRALDTRRPVISEDTVRLYDGSRLLYRSVLLPLGDDDACINVLLGAANGQLVST